jgi:uncharacterized membrane protein
MHFIIDAMSEFVNRSWTHLGFLGISFLFIGLLIVLVPKILIAFIATIFFILGIFLLIWARRLRKFHDKSYRIKINI